jgi:hypothetical protein
MEGQQIDRRVLWEKSNQVRKQDAAAVFFSRSRSWHQASLCQSDPAQAQRPPSRARPVRPTLASRMSKRATAPRPGHAGTGSAAALTTPTASSVDAGNGRCQSRLCITFGKQQRHAACSIMQHAPCQHAAAACSDVVQLHVAACSMEWHAACSVQQQHAACSMQHGTLAACSMQRSHAAAAYRCMIQHAACISSIWRKHAAAAPYMSSM